jgi:hypothetical protein
VIELSVAKNVQRPVRACRRYCSGVHRAWRWNMAMNAEALL